MKIAFDMIVVCEAINAEYVRQFRTFKHECKVTHAKRFIIGYFVISKIHCNFEPELHADKRRSTAVNGSQKQAKMLFAKS